MKAVGLTRYLPIDDPDSLLDIELDLPEPYGHDLLRQRIAIDGSFTGIVPSFSSCQNLHAVQEGIMKAATSPARSCQLREESHGCDRLLASQPDAD